MSMNRLYLTKTRCLCIFTFLLSGFSQSKALAEPQGISNQQLGLAIHILNSTRRTLEAADHDYNGHRAAAVRDIGAAERQVDEALGWAVKNIKGFTAPHRHEPQILSNEQLMGVIPILANTVTLLQSANHDYGGHRARAVRDLEAAIVQLEKALQFRHGLRHGRSRGGRPGVGGVGNPGVGVGNPGGSNPGGSNPGVGNPGVGVGARPKTGSGTTAGGVTGRPGAVTGNSRTRMAVNAKERLKALEAHRPHHKKVVVQNKSHPRHAAPGKMTHTVKPGKPAHVIKAKMPAKRHSAHAKVNKAAGKHGKGKKK